ncbi:hypothetical protein RRF57_003974 [Xylaria bambusicola]|uniref:Co-chaperone HscB C-terminal oligomerisation domain-containing protein n=1 Tax=Xylaria bambusicola TaxID=326684 RepID=A0AAN7UM51_9PEZI
MSMRSSIFPARQARRVCAFCRQQQQRQQQQITTTRNLHVSSTIQDRTVSGSSLAAVTRHKSYRPSHTSVPTTRQRPFSASAMVQDASQHAEPEVKIEADASEKPKAPETHYEFFPNTLPAGPPPKGPFDIDVRALRREFLSLQAGAHPDLHPAHMKSRAQAASARINEAFKTLSHPLLRAQYVLSLRGLDVGGDETAKVEDPELLMLVLETRETIEEAENEGDLEGLRAENEERIEESVGRLGDMFAKDDLEGAREEVVRLRYWVNIRESIDNWEKGKPVVLEH